MCPDSYKYTRKPKNKSTFQTQQKNPCGSDIKTSKTVTSCAAEGLPSKCWDGTSVPRNKYGSSLNNSTVWKCPDI